MIGINTSSVGYKSETFHSSVLGELSVLLDSEGALWFRFPDLARILALDSTARRRIDEDDRRVIHEPGRKGIGTTYVNEPGMYMMILASRKEKAVEAKRWITHDVLPAIRKYGGYIQGQENLPKAEQEALIQQVKALSKEVEEKTAALEKANEGKVKLERHLIEEEDRNFAKTERIAELIDEVKRLEAFTLGMMGSLSNISFTERYLEQLKVSKRFEAHRTEYDEIIREEKAQEVTKPVEQKPIIQKPAAKKPMEDEYDPDPIVRDPYGNIGRRSELLARDFR